MKLFLRLGHEAIKYKKLYVGAPYIKKVPQKFLWILVSKSDVRYIRGQYYAFPFFSLAFASSTVSPSLVRY